MERQASRMVIVFDTFAWIEYFTDTKNADVIESYIENGDIITPSIVLLELSYKADKEGWDFKKHLDFIKIKSKIVGMNEEFILKFGKIYNESKKKVKGMGLADIYILTTAILNNGKVLTGDIHFESFEQTIFLE